MAATVTSAAGRSPAEPGITATVPAANAVAAAARPRLSGCRSLRLDQHLAGWLSIRLLPDLNPADPVAAPLLFAGMLVEGSRPLRCDGGRCELDGPILLQISSVASGRAGGLQPFAFLSHSRLAQGRCRLEEGQVSCQARDSEGRHWSADVRW
ncbi:MAG: hypothetical protein ACKOXO_09370 [Cyanobium sp.]